MNEQQGQKPEDQNPDPAQNHPDQNTCPPAEQQYPPQVQQHDSTAYQNQPEEQIPERYQHDYQAPSPFGPAPVNPNTQQVPDYHDPNQPHVPQNQQFGYHPHHAQQQNNPPGDGQQPYDPNQQGYDPQYQNQQPCGQPYQDQQGHVQQDTQQGQYQQQQGYPQPGYSPNSARYQELAMGRDKKKLNPILVGLGVAGIGCFGVAIMGIFLVFSGLFYLGTSAPPTEILSARSIDQGVIDIVQADGNLQQGDKIEFIYSDGLSYDDVYYAVTTSHVVIHDDYSGIHEKIAYEEIIDVQALYSDNFFTDGTCTIYTIDDELYTIPISSENGTDEDFVSEIIFRSGL